MTNAKGDCYEVGLSAEAPAYIVWIQSRLLSAASVQWEWICAQDL